jgi:hypothetical protein
LAVIRVWGKSKPEFRIAERTRSRDSRTAASPRPTIVNEGRPERMSTSTKTGRGWTPSMANVATRASMTQRYAASGDPWVTARANCVSIRAAIVTHLSQRATHLSHNCA